MKSAFLLMPFHMIIYSQPIAHFIENKSLIFPLKCLLRLQRLFNYRKRNLIMKKFLTVVFVSLFALNGFSQLSSLNHFKEFPDPKPADAGSWKATTKGAHSGFVSEDKAFSRSSAPARSQVVNTWKKKAWRGERVNGQLLIYSTIPLRDIKLEVSDLKNPSQQKISKNSVHASFVRYVMTDLPGNLKSGCGITQKLDSALHADMIDNITSFSMEAKSSRPVWLSVDVPADAQPGIYKGSVKITSKEYNAIHPFTIEVLNHTLPAAKDWTFHLDLWQNPYSDARVYGVKPWSDEHFKVMKPNYEMLANAGQKVITATLIEDPWSSQTYDVYGGMIKWTKEKDGSWKYDYSIFDKWVNFMMSLGIDKQINCYSMIPWSLKFTYFDEASGKNEVLETKPGTEEYAAHWTRMLKDFAGHLKKKGWFPITMIAMDERPEKDMLAAISVIKSADPDFKISMAGNYHEALQATLSDYCIASDQHMSQAVLDERKAKGFVTTFYTACPEIFPNTFTSNQYSDASWLSWHALHKNFDGYLRWAYNCWNADPMKDSRFGSWAGGDTYFVYPGAKSSIRFERLREGIQDFEKFKILRAQLEKAGKSSDVKRLDDILKDFELKNLNGSNSNVAVDKARNILNSF
jgi:hypothetical protein